MSVPQVLQNSVQGCLSICFSDMASMFNAPLKELIVRWQLNRLSVWDKGWGEMGVGGCHGKLQTRQKISQKAPRKINTGDLLTSSRTTSTAMSPAPNCPYREEWGNRENGCVKMQRDLTVKTVKDSNIKCLFLGLVLLQWLTFSHCSAFRT